MLRKRPETEQSYPEEIENEFSPQDYPIIDYDQLESSNFSPNESEQEFVQNVLTKLKSSKILFDKNGKKIVTKCKPKKKLDLNRATIHKFLIVFNQISMKQKTNVETDGYL